MAGRFYENSQVLRERANFYAEARARDLQEHHDWQVEKAEIERELYRREKRDGRRT